MANFRNVALLCLASASALQAQHRFPLKYVGPADARSTITVGTIFPMLRSLPGGRLMVSDTAHHRTVILDASLAPVAAMDSIDHPSLTAYLGASRTDSAPLLRVNPHTHAVDTVARVRVASSTLRLDTLNGAPRWRATVEVLPTIDEWTTLPDGTIAVVRGADYHIDWYRADGTKTSTPPMQIDWRRLTDAEKRSRVESTRAAYEATNNPHNDSDAPSIEFQAPNTLPDFLPPVFIGGVRSDPQGNVWIAPTSSSYAGYAGFMYDVVNRRGQIVERVRLPKDRVLVGFSDTGDIYMVAMEANGMYLERARR
jgi:hypothetical protein